MPSWRDNPYLDLFYGHLDGAEMAEEEIPLWPPTRRDAALAVVDAVHFHWPETYWRGGGRRAGGKPLLGFRRFLAAIRNAGKPIIWTVHNLLPHERPTWRDRLARRLLLRASDMIICHDDCTASKVRRIAPRRAEIVVMPHGNYDGSLPAPRDIEETRSRYLNGRRKKLAVMLGLMRDYKGFDIALAAMEKVPDVHLVIAGGAHRSFEADALTHKASGRSNVSVQLGYLPDQELANLYGAADLALFPYLRITGSGALLTSLTLGCPAVASDLDYFQSILGGSPQAGRLFPVGDANALATGIRGILDTNRSETRAAALSLSAEYGWDRSAAIVEPPLLRLLEGGRR